MPFPQVWQLEQFFPHPGTDEFRAVVDDWRKRWTSLADASENLASASGPAAKKVWGDFVERWSLLIAESEDLFSFLHCHAAADAENKVFQQWEATLGAISPIRARVGVNVEFAVRGADGSTAASVARVSELIAADARLAPVRFALDEAARNAAFRLPKAEELLAADLSVDGIQAWSRLYDRLSGSLKIEVMEKGEVVRKSPGQIHFDSPDRSVRQNNFYAADKAWQTLADTCADSLNHIAGFRLAKYRRSGHSHLDWPLRLNRMQHSTLKAMWDVVTQRKGVLLKYLDRKAKLLGLQKLSWYDMQAPLPETWHMLPACDSKSSQEEKAHKREACATELSYEEACRQILETFTRFSPDFGEFAKMAMSEGWIEVENRAGKRQGAYCTGFPVRKQSRIFMTYTNTPDSMSTLAHELGHAYHSWVLRDQPFLLQDYPMNLAETASTFAETVLAEERLAAAKTSAEKLAVLDGMLGDAVAFLMNIHARFVFEDRFHQERAAGEVSAERLSQLMLQAQKETYQNGLADDGWYPGFWISKLHFYINSWPFYNFPYTFGYLLSQGVYALRS